MIVYNRRQSFKFEATESQVDRDHMVVELPPSSVFGRKPAEKLLVIFYFPRQPYKGSV